MPNLLHAVFKYGINESDTFDLASKIRFSNQICAFFLIIMALYSSFFYFIKLPLLGIQETIACLTFIGALILNKNRKFNAAKIVIILNTALSIYIASIITGKQVCGQFFLTFLIPLSLMFFEKKQKKLRLFGLSIPLISFTLLELTNYASFYQAHLDEFMTQLLYVSVFVINGVIIFLMVQFYIQLSEHHSNNIQKLITIYSVSNREIDIISILLQGKTNKEIAEKLFIEESTVKTHLYNIFQKLNVKSRIELMAKFMPKT